MSAGKQIRKHVLQWHILHQCNLRCTHCYQDDFVSELSRDQLEDLFYQYLDFCRTKNYHGHINFTGGEPLLSPDLFYLMKLCDDNRMSCGLLTNGTLIDKNTAESLSKVKNLSFVQVSIDGTRKTHDSIRGNGNFDKAFAGLKLLKKYSIQTMVSFTCHRGNYNELKPVIRTVRRKGIDRFWTDRLIPIGGSREQMLSTEEYRNVIRVLTAEHSRKTLFSHTEVHLNRAMQFQEGGSCYYRCAAGTTLLTLLADGTLLPCRRLPIPIGNCLETDMLKLYNESDLVKDLQESKIPDECIACPKAELCRGGAKCLSYAVTGSYNVKDINCYYPCLLRKR